MFEIGYSKFGPKDDIEGLDEVDLTFTNFSAGIQYGGFGDRSRLDTVRILPYAFVMVGAYQVEGQVTVGGGLLPTPVTVDDSSTEFGLAVGGGINIKVTDSVGVQADVHFHNVDSGDWLNWATPSGGVYFSF